MSKEVQEKYMNLIQQHEGIIHKVIGLYVDFEQDKQDLYQEILLQGWKSFKRFRGESSFSTWLYKVALNTVLNFHKKRKRNQIGEVGVVAPLQQDEPIEDYELIYYIIKSFNDIDKMLITLHLDGYKNKEIAEISGMSKNHVNVKLHRLKAQIIEQFNTINHAG